MNKLGIPLELQQRLSAKMVTAVALLAVMNVTVSLVSGRAALRATVPDDHGEPASIRAPFLADQATETRHSMTCRTLPTAPCRSVAGVR